MVAHMGKKLWQQYQEVVFLYKIFTFQGNPVTHKNPVTAFKWILLILSGHACHRITEWFGLEGTLKII